MSTESSIRRPPRNRMRRYAQSRVHRRGCQRLRPDPVHRWPVHNVMRWAWIFCSDALVLGRYASEYTSPMRPSIAFGALSALTLFAPVSARAQCVDEELKEDLV